MNLNDMIDKYNKAIETDKIIEGQYQMLSVQLNRLLAELGMTYEEAIEKEKVLKAKLSDSIPKIQSYIQAVEEKRQLTEEQFV